jgi:hypothetical protein
MARNIYFSDKVKSEQDLYEDLVIESMKIYGQDVYYLPRTIVNENTILGDDIPSKFSNAYKIEMYLENAEGFGGEGHLFQKFGIEIRDQATFVVSRRRWAQTVSSFNNDIEGDLPVEGDLVYFPLTKSLFQIMFVERQSPFYQLSNLNVARLECELFEYNDEAIDTDIPEIDVIETLGYEVTLQLDSAEDNITAVVGDTITQTLSDGVTITAEVIQWDRARQQLHVAHVGASDGKYHMFVSGTSITSAETTAVRNIVSTSENLGDHYNQNDAFDSDVTFLDFSESNPFGDPS